MMGGAKRGFTLAEVLVVLVIASFAAVALHTAQVQYRRVATWSTSVLRDHDAFRVASSLLAADLREGVYEEGDVILHADDSLSVRAPLGFALVCSVRDNPASVGVRGEQGLRWAEPGDSLLVYTRSGWLTLSPTDVMANPPRTLDCDGSRPELAYSLPRRAADSIQVGAPVRTFRRHTYHVGMNGGAPWLARTDAAGTEMLVGPLLANGLRFRLMDASGSATARIDEATGVEVRLIFPLTVVLSGESASADTITLMLQGRNR